MNHPVRYFRTEKGLQFVTRDRLQPILRAFLGRITLAKPFDIGFLTDTLTIRFQERSNKGARTFLLTPWITYLPYLMTSL